MGLLAAEYSSVANTSPCTTCYLSYDHLGSVRLVTDGSGNIISRHDFLPFGEEVPALASTGRTGPGWGVTDDVNQRFTGKERDAESQLDYFGARYYGSALGRFTSPDWSAKPEPVPYADFSNPQTLNEYAYVLNNPLARPDPDGHCDGVADCFFTGVKLAGSAASAGVAAVETATVGAAAAVAGAVVYLGSPAVPGNIPSPDPGHYYAMAVDQYMSASSPGKPGTLGKPDHQQTANEEADRIGGQREVKIDTPGGGKGSRRADAAQVGESGKPDGEIVQVYRPTRAGNIPKWEVDAATDIKNATGITPTMVPVRPAKPPCSSGSGGGCQ